MEWISIEERLPDENVFVLVYIYDSRPRVKMFFIEIAERVEDYWYEGKDGSEITSGGRNRILTHWMPLPDPPGNE